MKRDLCLESRFARVDLQSINLYSVFFTLPMCISNDLILHWGRGYIMFVCYRHSKVHVQTNGTPLCNLFNKPVYPFKNFIPKMCPFCPQNMKRNICNTKTGLVAGVFNWIYLWRVYINQINERKAIFLTQHPNISLNKEGVWSTNLREIISEILTDRQTKTEQRTHLNRHPTVSPDFNTSLWFLLMHSIGPWNYISWSFCMFPICLWDLGTSHWSVLWFED